MESLETRQASNRKIVELLAEYVELFPDYRMIQILIASGLIVDKVDDFYTESTALLQRMLRERAELNTPIPDHYTKMLEHMHSLMPDGCSKDFLRESIDKPFSK